MDDWFGLYFQHVHFRQERWLKTTALYWDQLYHLYNDETETSLPRISASELALASEGVLRPITPRPETIERTATQFMAAASTLAPESYQVWTAPAGIERDFEESLASWKVSRPLVELLGEIGLIRAGDGDRWVMRRELVQAYLLMLAGAVASEIGAAPLADNSFQQSAVGLSVRRLVDGLAGVPPGFVALDEQRVFLVNLAVTTVLPRDIDRCPIEQIIDFRNSYPGERARFKHAVNSLVMESAQLEGLRDRDAVLDHLRARYASRIVPALNDLDRAMKGKRMDTVLGVMNIQAAAPAAVSSSVALLALNPSAAGATAIGLGGLAIGVWKSAHQASQQQQTTLKESSVSYLYHLRNDLNPVSLAERVREAVSRFAPWPTA